MAVNYVFMPLLISLLQGAIMAVGASKPAVVASKDGRIGMKNQMQVSNLMMYNLPFHALK